MDNTFIVLFIFSIILIENVHSKIIHNCPPLNKKICKSNKQIMCIEPPEGGVGCGELFCKPKKYNIKVGNKNIKCNNKCDRGPDQSLWPLFPRTGNLMTFPVLF